MKHLLKITTTRKCFSSEHTYSKYISKHCPVTLQELEQSEELEYGEQGCLILCLFHHEPNVVAVFPSEQLFYQSLLFFRTVGVEGKSVHHPVEY